MEASPSGAKRIPVTALLFPLLMVLVALGLTTWQNYAAKQPVRMPELTAAGNALKAGNVEQARQQFEKALGKADDPPSMYRIVMEECEAFGRWDLAAQYGERAIQVCRYAPNSARAGVYETLANCYADGHEPAPQPRAIEYAHRALELAPDDANALNTLGYILAKNVKTEAEANIALGYVNHALTLLRNQVGTSAEQLAAVEDSYGWALHQRGRFHIEDYAHAADALRQAVADLPEEFSNPIQKVMYYHLGAACRAAGQIEEARHALQIALLYDPLYPEAKTELNSLPPAAQSPQSVPATSVSASNTSPPVPPIAQAPVVPTQTSDGKPIFKPLTDNKKPSK